jgi:hypothetical protein
MKLLRKRFIAREVKSAWFIVIWRLSAVRERWEGYDSITDKFWKLALTSNFTFSIWPETAKSYEKSQYFPRFA